MKVRKNLTDKLSKNLTYGYKSDIASGKNSAVFTCHNFR